ncbi:MAG: PAS domain-containing protein [Planctomycetes bacterium]|nr:PAS domain-containing protein [Planctomycetota bacterium]
MSEPHEPSAGGRQSTALDPTALLAAAPDALVATDAAGTIVLAGGALRAVLGWDPVDLAGHPLAEVLPGGPPRGAGPERARARRRDGGEVEVEVTAAGRRRRAGPGPARRRACLAPDRGGRPGHGSGRPVPGPRQPARAGAPSAPPAPPTTDSWAAPTRTTGLPSRPPWPPRRTRRARATGSSKKRGSSTRTTRPPGRAAAGWRSAGAPRPRATPPAASRARSSTSRTPGAPPPTRASWPRRGASSPAPSTTT